VRREFLEGMVDIAAAGRTVLLSSHQISEVERVADIIAIIHAGKLILVERLEMLKDEIRELSITLADSEPSPPGRGQGEGAAADYSPNTLTPTLSQRAREQSIPGQILLRRQHRHQLQLIVRGLSEPDLDALRSQSWVQELRLRTPSLEEIFVAYLKSSETNQQRSTAPTELTAK
jgi:ABC-2 type transport system ATP-binding protein